MNASVRNSIVGGLLAASLAFALYSMNPGPVKEASRHVPSGNSRLLVIFAKGMSWEDVIPLSAERRLPFLREVVEGKSSYGDIMAGGYLSEGEIHASMITGTLPARHRIVSLRDGKRVPAIWDILAARGEPATVLGFPSFSTVTGRNGDTDAHRAVMARDGLQDPARHVFLYLDGIARAKERAVTNNASARADLDAAYVALDNLFRRITAGLDDGTAVVVLSEEGFRSHLISYRPFLPTQEPPVSVGCLVAWGGGLKRSELPHTLSPTDVAPTLLYLAGVPVPNWLDGSVVMGMLEDDTYFRKKLQSSR